MEELRVSADHSRACDVRFFGVTQGTAFGGAHASRPGRSHTTQPRTIGHVPYLMSFKSAATPYRTVAITQSPPAVLIGPYQTPIASVDTPCVRPHRAPTISAREAHLRALHQASAAESRHSPRLGAGCRCRV